MDWEERERYDLLVRYLSGFCSFQERETGFVHFTACSDSSLRTEI